MKYEDEHDARKASIEDQMNSRAEEASEQKATLAVQKEESFTKGNSFVCSEERIQSFSRVGKRFGCVLCGHIFKVGDSARWIYANGTPGAGTGNFFVCRTCDVGGNDHIISMAKISLDTAVKLAKQWDIYGPDWDKAKR